MCLVSAKDHPFNGILSSLPKLGGGEFGKFYSLRALNDPRIENFLLKGSTLVSKRLETWLEKHVTFLKDTRRYEKTARAVEEWKQMHLQENPNAPVPAMTDADEAETQRKINEELWESSELYELPNPVPAMIYEFWMFDIYIMFQVLQFLFLY